jgi:hypothetical protein
MKGICTFKKTTIQGTNGHPKITILAADMENKIFNISVV